MISLGAASLQLLPIPVSHMSTKGQRWRPAEPLAAGLEPGGLESKAPTRSSPGLNEEGENSLLELTLGLRRGAEGGEGVTVSAMEGAMVALVKVCRCWGPAGPLAR